MSRRPKGPQARWTPLAYHHLQRAGRSGVWRPIVGMLLGALGVFVLSSLVWTIPFAIFLSATGMRIEDALTTLTDLKNPTPVFLAYVNVSLATAIPITWLINRTLHGLRPRWLASVWGGLRWRFLLVCLGLSVVALVATLVVSALMPSGAIDGSQMGTELKPWTPEIFDYLLVVLLLTPFQAAGEEYFFRGYLTQAFGGLLGSRVVAVIAPALLFALAHGSQDWPVFFDRFAFGLVAGVLVIVTGGLEAAIAMHVLNNFLAFGLALAFSDMATAMNPTGGSWWSIVTTLTQSLVYLGLCTFVARRMGLCSTVFPSVLAASGAPVYRSSLRP